jgi:RNA-binding protein 25
MGRRRAGGARERSVLQRPVSLSPLNLLSRLAFRDWLLLIPGHFTIYCRLRWRSQRLPIRRREEDADEADRLAEIEEVAALQRESEDFLDRQMKDLADLAVKQKAAGILTDDVGPVKLNIVAKPHPPPTTAPVALALPVSEARVFVEEEEEEVKKKRVLVKLDYGETQEALELKRVQGLAKIRLEKLPKTREALFKIAVKWEAITEVGLRFPFPFFRSRGRRER